MEEKIKRIEKLVRKMQQNFRGFYLAGGTALMIKHHHRISEDIDLFKKEPFSFTRLALKIRKLFKVEKEEHFTDNVDFIINDIKVSFVFFPFKSLKPLEVFEGIKIASDYDIFLNKIYSAGRRIESKDVIDFAFLYKKYGWDKGEVKKDFEKKFPQQSFEIYLGAILSAEDYPEINKKTLKIIKEVKEKWIR